MNANGAGDLSEKYFIRVRGKVLGPFPLEKLKALRARGQFSRVHEVSTDRATWQPATSIDPLLGFAKTAPAAAPIETETFAVAAPQPAATAPLAAGPAATWHYSIGDERHGPVSILELRGLLNRGMLGANDFVWKEGMADWSPIFATPELRPPENAALSSGAGSSAKTGSISDDGIHHTSGFAVSSLVLGILGLMTPFLVFNILATVFAAVAMKSINRSRIQLGGRGMAITGLILGIIGLCGWAMFLLFWFGALAALGLGVTNSR